MSDDEDMRQWELRAAQLRQEMSPGAELAEPRGQLAPRALFNSVYARFRREQN